MIAKRLFIIKILACLCLFPARAQAQNMDLNAVAEILKSINTEMVRLRGFIRAAETQSTKVVDLSSLILTPPPPGPPTVLDWRTGEWDLMAAGYTGLLDLTKQTVTTNGVTFPITATAIGDTLRLRPAVPGYGNLVEISMAHAEGRMIGTVTYDTIVRPATAQRGILAVVQDFPRGSCRLAQFSDGSWGITPTNSTCFQSLEAYLREQGLPPMKFTPREYIPGN